MPRQGFVSLSCLLAHLLQTACVTPRLQEALVMSHTPPSETPLPLADVQRLSAQQVHGAQQQGEAPLLVDVREEWEWAQGHIPGATWAPLSRLPEASAQLQGAQDRFVVTYCHHGVRSLKAAAWLQAHGFAHVASMDGGIDAWATDVDDSVGRY